MFQMEVAQWSLSRVGCFKIETNAGGRGISQVCASFSEAYTSAKFQRALDRNRRLQGPGRKKNGQT